MKNLWRATTYLFWQYPILWLPVIFAEVAGFCLNQFQRWLHHQLIQYFLPWLTESHSVLGPLEHLEPTQAVMFKFGLINMPLTLSIRFLGTLLIASAMVAIAGLLRNIAATGRGDIQTIKPTVAASSRRILVYASKLFVLSALLGSLIGFLMLATMNYQRSVERWLPLSLKSEIALEKMNIPGYAWSLPLTLATAYIMAPIAIKLLQPPGSTPSPHQAKRARIAWILAAIAATVLGILVSNMETSFLQQLQSSSSLITHLVWAISSVITTAPNIPLFIAFYLIATPDSPLATPPTAQLEADIPT